MLATLLTDFGTADYFVGAMKGALLSVCAGAQVIDLTHEIPPHDIEAGAFALLAAYDAFPAGTVHVAVVDPGVGSARRPLLLTTRGASFVAPDNGLLSYVAAREPDAQFFQLTNRRYFRASVSDTFHGRDVFAPVAGWLLRGVSPSELGEPVGDAVRLPLSAPRRRSDGTLEAAVIHIDRFGNCITNLTRADLPDAALARGTRLHVGRHEITTFRRFFAQSDEADEHATSTPPAPDESQTSSPPAPDAPAPAATPAPFAIWGSAGFLEIAIFRDSAARRLNIHRGQAITVTSDE